MKRIALTTTIALVLPLSLQAAGPTAPAMPPAPATCPLITTFLTRSSQNDTADVMRLQAFLRDHEHANVSVNGSFDQQTEDAVKAFQKAHADIILKPYNIINPTGRVSITTRALINSIACNIPMTLSNGDMSDIARIAQGPQASSPASATTASAPMTANASAAVMTGPAAPAPSSASSDAPTITLTQTTAGAPMTDADGDGTPDDSQMQAVATVAATAANPTVLTYFWAFIRGMFR